MKIFIAFLLIIMGIIGDPSNLGIIVNPSNLGNPPNTAVLVLLTGIILLFK